MKFLLIFIHKEHYKSEINQDGLNRFKKRGKSAKLTFNHLYKRRGYPTYEPEKFL